MPILYESNPNKFALLESYFISHHEISKETEPIFSLRDMDFRFNPISRLFIIVKKINHQAKYLHKNSRRIKGIILIGMYRIPLMKRLISTLKNDRFSVLIVLTAIFGQLCLGGCRINNNSVGNPPVIPDAPTARDFTLTFLNRKYSLALPGGEASWDVIDLILDEDASSEAYLYSNGGISVVISYPKSNPVERVFNIAVRNQDNSFNWNGLLDASGHVREITLEMATNTPIPTATMPPSQTPFPTSTMIPTSTLHPTFTPTPYPTQTATSTPDPCNWASFVGDITIPDGTTMAPGTTFTKIWRIKNVGSCTWNQEYDLVFVRGDRMDAPESLPIPRLVTPGDSVDLAITMRAPQRYGDYRGFWMLQSPSGDRFGLGPAANLTFWTSLTVLETFSDYRYDFTLNICSAIWRSATGRLNCTNTTDSPDGYIRLLENPTLESGRENEAALWMHPNETRYGWIDGTYPYYSVALGDRFKSAVGCLADYGSCNLYFYLDYEDVDGRINRLGRWQEVYDGAITEIDIDLSNLAGVSVRFILGVESNIQDSEDAQGFWLLPRIENPE